jgi:hypothetical protein
MKIYLHTFNHGEIRQSPERSGALTFAFLPAKAAR